MLDYKGLQSTQSAKDDQQNNRAMASIDCYEQGRQLFEEAIQNNYDKSLIEDASVQFLKGISLKRTEIYNYIGISYLLLTIGQAREAIKTLKAAQLLEPSNKTVLHLLLKAQELKNAPEASGVSPLNVSIENIDFDALYEEVEQEIYRSIQSIMENNQYPIQPTLTSSKVHQFQEEVNTLTKLYQQLLEKILLIEKDIDGKELRKKLKPFELRLKLLNTGINVSKYFKDIQIKIERQIKWSLTIIQNLSEKTLAVMEIKLDELMDHCDSIADEIDALESKGFVVKELEFVYNKLIVSIGSIQDKLDDFVEEELLF